MYKKKFVVISKGIVNSQCILVILGLEDNTNNSIMSKKHSSEAVTSNYIMIQQTLVIFPLSMVR